MKVLELERVFKKYYTSLYVYAMQILRDEELSKDMVADTFEYVCKKVVSIDETNIQSLLYATLRSRCIDHLRHEKVHERYADYCRAVTSLDANSNYEEYENRYNRLKEAMGQLNERTRKILEACYFEKKKYKEAAEEFGISEHGIRKQVYRAIDQLRKYIKNVE